MTMLRKDFVLGTLAAAGAALIGCGDDSSSSTGGSGGESSGGAPSTGGNSSGGSPASGGGGGAGLACTSDISLNHGHELAVSQADVDAGVDKTYDIMGASAHAHSVVVTAADFATIAANGSVTIASSMTEAHTHDVTVTCTG
jgi:hypothetical protein